jgi:hypothetical protein
MGASAPKQVSDLVERSERDRKAFLSPDYKEEQLRASSGPSPSIRHSSFDIRISPHESLGWDVANKAGLTGACPERSRRVFKPVIHEESIKARPERSRRIAGATKASYETLPILAVTEM